ncbi:hypothetical protein FRC12_019089 [Ceratobasidium sp. 428]|nr:hypothetical protein FRC12_019089 [Ceratobasidium sp. 428]
MPSPTHSRLSSQYIDPIELPVDYNPRDEARTSLANTEPQAPNGVHFIFNTHHTERRTSAAVRMFARAPGTKVLAPIRVCTPSPRSRLLDDQSRPLSMASPNATCDTSPGHEAILSTHEMQRYSTTATSGLTTTLHVNNLASPVNACQEQERFPMNTKTPHPSALDSERTPRPLSHIASSALEKSAGR